MIYLINEIFNQSGDNMEIEKLVNDYGSYIYNYALKLSCHPDTANDLTQETFINAWKNINSLNNISSIKPWLRKICFNLFLMNMRKEKSRIKTAYDASDVLNNDTGLLSDSQMYISHIPTPEDEVIVDESIKEMQNGCFLAMVRKLTLNQRIVFSLIDMFGLSIHDVSVALNITEGAVKGLLYRAHMNLDSFFADHCSVINVNNPCSCKAWIQFSKVRSNMQQKAQAKNHKFVKHLDYKNFGYKFNEETRKKINYLYKNMPQKKPSETWYDNVIDIIREMNAAE